MVKRETPLLKCLLPLDSHQGDIGQKGDEGIRGRKGPHGPPVSNLYLRPCQFKDCVFPL